MIRVRESGRKKDEVKKKKKKVRRENKGTNGGRGGPASSRHWAPGVISTSIIGETAQCKIVGAVNVHARDGKKTAGNSGGHGHTKSTKYFIHLWGTAACASPNEQCFSGSV